MDREAESPKEPKRPGSDTEQVRRFYDSLASRYDRMTGLPSRLEREMEVLRPIVREFNIASALDAGAGTGVTALCLARLNVLTTAVDISDEMITLLREHARAMDLKINAVVSDLLKAHSIIEGVVDAVFCLGNTLSHFRQPDQLGAVLHEFRALLRPKGLLVVQVLNFQRFGATGSLPVIERNNIVRRYSRTGGNVSLRISEQGGGGRQPLEQALTMHPIHSQLLAQLLEIAGFVGVQVYGDLQRTPFDENASSDLVAFAFAGS